MMRALLRHQLIAQTKATPIGNRRLVLEYLKIRNVTGETTNKSRLCLCAVGAGLRQPDRHSEVEMIALP